MDSNIFAKEIRKHALDMVYRANASHIGGALSSVDILAVLYDKILNIYPDEPESLNRDRFIFSKGHACTALYACLALKGFFDIKELETYCQDGSRLMAHVSHKVPGIEFSTGSLGHGLPFATGKAIAAKNKSLDWNTYCLLSDGELDEGSNWEAILFAGHHRLKNLSIIIDYNKIQSLGSVHQVLDIHPLKDKMESFRWHTIEVDGHSHNDLLQAFNEATQKPKCIIAHTIKGKGVDFMENT